MHDMFIKYKKKKPAKVDSINEMCVFLCCSVAVLFFVSFILRTTQTKIFDLKLNWCAINRLMYVSVWWCLPLWSIKLILSNVLISLYCEMKWVGTKKKSANCLVIDWFSARVHSSTNTELMVCYMWCQWYT